VDVARIAAEAVEGAQAIEPDRTMELSADEEAVIDGDAGRLRQVFDNLLENARVHTPAGTPTRVAVNPNGETVTVTVTDEGPGMDAEVAAQAFERFYRGDPARASSTGGAGLGLSIVAAIVEAHGGTVGVAAGDGGTTIEIRLPRTRPSAAAPEV
jgi:two-component system OmpR family sensor kinase